MLKSIAFCACALLAITAATSIPQDTIKPVVIVLVGPPGSGQGVLAIKTANLLSIPHLSTAKLIQDLLYQETAMSQKAHDYLSSGEEIPDSFISEILQERIKTTEHFSRGFLLSGIPRTIDQAQELENILNDQYKLIVISISIPDTILLLRDEGRLICQNCGRVYHKQFSPPVNAMSCDFCRNTLTQRYDDSPETIRRKLDDHRKNLNPVLQFYKEHGTLMEVNGDCPLETTFEEIQKCYNACIPTAEYAFLND